jgi:hypothetical protein
LIAAPTPELPLTAMCFAGVTGMGASCGGSERGIQSFSKVLNLLEAMPVSVD